MAKHEVETVIRDPYYAKCNGSEFFENLATTATEDVVMYAPCTAPFVKRQSIELAIKIYESGKYDSVVSVIDLKEHVWHKNKPVNYDPYVMPNSQDLRDTYIINYGFGILHFEKMMKCRNIVTDNNYFYPLDEIESVDIDTPLEFEFAQWMKERI